MLKTNVIYLHQIKMNRTITSCVHKNAELEGRRISMVRRICPICDHPMKGRYYCRECRSFVKHPYTMNVDYYLNERHPAKEGDCEYHHPSFMDPAASSQNQSGASNPARVSNQSRTSNQSGLSSQFGASNSARASNQSRPQGRSWPMPNAQPNNRQYSQPWGRQGSRMDNRNGSGYGSRNNSNVGMIVAAVVVIIFLLNLLLPLMMFIL